MEKKTAMEELIEYMNKHLTPTDVIFKAKSLLPKEREQIEEAFEAGFKERGSVKIEPFIDGSDYFTQTYQQ